MHVRQRARRLLGRLHVELRRHRAAIFGVGWSIADSCPAPIAAQLTQGVVWSVFTIAGIWIGVVLFLRRQERGARSPKTEPLGSLAVDSRGG